MEILNFVIQKKEITCDTKVVIGGNDYQANFLFDEEFDDKKIICRVVYSNKTSLDILIENMSCIIPAYILKSGKISVGVYTEDDENYATAYCDISVKESIKEKNYETSVPNEEIWNDIKNELKEAVKSEDFDKMADLYMETAGYNEKLENAMQQYGDENKFNLIRFLYTDIGLKSRELHVDGRYLYVGCFGGQLLKMDVGIESNPTVEWQITLDATNNINGIACDEKYLYVCDRDPAAWSNRTDGTTIGHLYVLDKSDGSIINTVELSGKGTGIALYDHYAIVSMQIYGWAIYDIADTENITAVYEYLQTDYNKGEFQKCKVITLSNKPYLFISGFDHGLTVWDISTITAPTKVHEFDLKALNIAEYGGKREQCFDMVKVDNYLYMPIAPLSAYLTDTTIRRGIIRLDLSDMTKMDNNEFEYYSIELNDWAVNYGESDTNPNAIVRMGNILLINNAGLGLGMYLINDDYGLNYLKTVKVTTDGVVRPMVATDDGRLVIAPDNSKGKDRVVAIYRPQGISY